MRSFLIYYAKVDRVRDKLNYSQTQEYLKLLNQFKKNGKFWVSMTKYA